MSRGIHAKTRAEQLASSIDAVDESFASSLRFLWIAGKNADQKNREAILDRIEGASDWLKYTATGRQLLQDTEIPRGDLRASRLH